jgi:hypothetical protein
MDPRIEEFHADGRRWEFGLRLLGAFVAVSARHAGLAVAVLLAVLVVGAVVLVSLVSGLVALLDAQALAAFVGREDAFAVLGAVAVIVGGAAVLNASLRGYLADRSGLARDAELLRRGVAEDRARLDRLAAHIRDADRR